MKRVLIAVAVLVALSGCGSDTEGSGTADRTSATGSMANSQQTDQPVTVSGTLGAKKLDKGVCAWVETGPDRIEIWVDDKYGQVFAFNQDDTLEGIRTVDPANPGGPVGEVAFAAGERISVTGTKYESTPECGSYGVRATQPITAG